MKTQANKTMTDADQAIVEMADQARAMGVSEDEFIKGQQEFPMWKVIKMTRELVMNEYHFANKSNTDES